MISKTSISQETIDTLRLKKQRNLFIGTSTALTGISLYALNETWYKDFPRSKFHTFNDSHEWLQMDKMGHAFTCYQIGKAFYNAYPKAHSGTTSQKFLLGSAGLLYMTGIEILDGKSSQWGFSWSDMAANFSGYFLFAAQDNFFKKQIVQLKFSYSNSPYAMLRSETLGRNFQQRLLKDYNAQTYWMNIPLTLKAAPRASFTKWLCVSIGYSANEILYADNNINSVNNFHSTREFFLSFDADLNKIVWKRKWMKKVARVLNVIKIPAPTIRVRSDGSVKVLPLYF